MNRALVLGAIFLNFAAVYVNVIIKKPLVELTEKNTCPQCYGTDFCSYFEDNEIYLEYRDIWDVFNRIFGVKNVYFAIQTDAKNRTRRIVLKKLAHQWELQNIQRDQQELDLQLFLDHPGNLTHFKTCSPRTSAEFLSKISESQRWDLRNLWTILQVNVEPLILEIFKGESYPVAAFLGSCGRLVVESYCGGGLLTVKDTFWHKRASLAVQLLQGALNFTNMHPDFRLYLTDISPDNVAVDVEGWKVTFVDLEGAILASKQDPQRHNSRPHYSPHFADEPDFLYSELEICESPVSDHNIYAVCRLFLSQNAPWPMMKNGLLHSPPPHVAARNEKLFTLIENCVHSQEEISRFELAYDIIKLLQQEILSSTIV